MKKSLIAVAVLAVSGAAFAQSVKLYGVVDVWGGTIKNKNNAEAGGPGQSLTQTKLDSGGIDTSIWGIQGSEDLGGGLKANFMLEQGFQVDSGAADNDTGTSGTQTFDRQSWVGLSGGFGEIQIGKPWTAFDDVFGASDAVFDSVLLAPANEVFKSAAYRDHPANGVRYNSPTVAGFTGVVTYALGETKAATGRETSIAAANITYEEGPIGVQFGYQVEESVTSSSDQRYALLGGSYDFGIAVGKVIIAHVSNVDNVAGADAREYQLGVDVPVNETLTVSASYARSDDSLPAGAYEPTRKGFGLGATYTLSKRTYAYGGYTYREETQQANPDAKVTVFALGIRHSF